jgi:uncharacterized protein YjiK
MKAKKKQPVNINELDKLSEEELQNALDLMTSKASKISDKISSLTFEKESYDLTIRLIEDKLVSLG